MTKRSAAYSRWMHKHPTGFFTLQMFFDDVMAMIGRGVSRWPGKNDPIWDDMFKTEKETER